MTPSKLDLLPYSATVLTSRDQVRAKVKERLVRSAFFDPSAFLQNMIFSTVNGAPQGGSNYQPGRKKRSDPTLYKSSDVPRAKMSEETSADDREKRSLIDDTSSYLRSMVFKKIKKEIQKYYPKFCYNNVRT